MSFRADMTGKWAFITGASGTLGSHFARVLAGAGAGVILAARRVSVLSDLADDINSSGGRAIAVAVDVRDGTSVNEAVSVAIDMTGAIDVLVNNSGITVTAPVLEHTEDQWDQVIDTNLKGAFLVATAVARTMRDGNRGGSIINVASILGMRQAAQVCAYAVSKAGLVQLTKLLALELARYSIRVNAIAPGYVESDLNREFWQSAAGAAMTKRIPQRRLGRLSDLNGPLLLLASGASEFTTGSILAVDGGHLVSGL